MASRRRPSRPALASIAALAAAVPLLLLLVAPAHAAGTGPPAFPAVGRLSQPSVVVRAAPRLGAKRIALVRQFRPDYRPQVLLATDARADAAGRLWYRVNVPSPSNRLSGWVLGSALLVETIPERIVVHRGTRTLELYRGRKLVLRTRVAVGKPGAETPIGRFYVTAKFRPELPWLGEYTLETSAHSRLSEWPGGGVVAIHGTPQPWLLGRAVSHGCIRVRNDVALRLRRLAPLGTPIEIVS